MPSACKHPLFSACPAFFFCHHHPVLCYSFKSYTFPRRRPLSSTAEVPSVHRCWHSINSTTMCSILLTHFPRTVLPVAYLFSLTANEFVCLHIQTCFVLLLLGATCKRFVETSWRQTYPVVLGTSLTMYTTHTSELNTTSSACWRLALN